MDINKKFRDLAKKKMQRDALDEEIKAIEDEIKEHMTAEDLTELIGKEHKATWTEFSRSTIDTKLLKKEMPKVAERYTKSSVTRRFTFA